MNKTNPINRFLGENIYLTILSVLLIIASAAFYVFSWQNGLSAVINWQVLSELNETVATIDHFNIGSQAFEIPSKIYFISEQFLASGMAINYFGTYLWLSIFSITFCILAAVVSNLKSYWYFGGMAILILSLVSFNFDTVYNSSQYLISSIILGIFILISYYFYAFGTIWGYFTRFLAFAIFTLLLAFCIKYFAKEPLPFLYLSTQTIPSAMILASLFVFWISYELILLILTISTNGGSNNSLLNFTIGSIILLINVLLTHLHNINHLAWNMLYLSPFILLLLSIIAGFINLQKKIDLFREFTTSFSGIYLLYIVGSIFTLGVIGYGFSTGNDPLVESLEDAIMYCHLVMGFCFFGYVFINFLPLFKQGFDVSKVAFKPLHFQLYYFRGASILILFAILTNNLFYPIMQSFSGYYNAVGDHATASRQLKLAEAYYKTALGYERQNHKSNYAMATLAAMQGDNPTAGSFYRLAVQKKPSAYAFVALSNSLAKEDLFFEAVFALKDGLKIFPKSSQIQNNLALLFAKSKAPDSCLYYLEKANINAENKGVTNTNLLWFWLKNANIKKAQELLANEKPTNYNALNANILATKIIGSGKGLVDNNYEFVGDSSLSMANFAWLYNQTISNSMHNKYTNIPYTKLMENEGNFNIAKDLQQAHIFNEYYAGNKLLALDIMASNVSADTSKAGKYDQMLFNTLLKKAKEIPSKTSPAAIITLKDAEEATKYDPLDPQVLEKSILILNKNKQEKKAYDLLINTLNWQKTPQIQKLYIQQCFKIHMNTYAKDGMETLKLMNLNEYNSFLPVYQAQIALVEKDKEGFN